MCPGYSACRVDQGRPPVASHVSNARRLALLRPLKRLLIGPNLVTANLIYTLSKDTELGRRGGGAADNGWAVHVGKRTPLNTCSHSLCKITDYAH
jgi:hypothetical protein